MPWDPLFYDSIGLGAGSWEVSYIYMAHYTLNIIHYTAMLDNILFTRTCLSGNAFPAVISHPRCVLFWAGVREQNPAR